MIIKGQSDCKGHIKNVLNKIQGINKWRYDFIVEVLVLFLSIKGRINFLQLERYGKHKEQRYRGQFEKQFDFLTFNKDFYLLRNQLKQRFKKNAFSVLLKRKQRIKKKEILRLRGK